MASPFSPKYQSAIYSPASARSAINVPLAFRNYATRFDQPIETLGAYLGGTSKLRFKNRVPFNQGRVVLPLYYLSQTGSGVQEVPIAGNITLSCALEYPKGSGTFYPFTFGGLASVTVTAAAYNNLLVSDNIALPFFINSDTDVGIRTFIQCAATGAFLCGAYAGGAGFVEGAEYSATTPVDKTQSGTIADGFLFAYCPVAFLTPGTLPSFAIWGDSISHGVGDNASGSGFTSGDGNGCVGWPQKYFYKAGMGSLKLGCSAERMAQALLGRWTTRLRLAQLCNAAGNLLQGGVNDIVLGDVTTLQQMKDNIVAIQALVAPYTPNAPWLGGTLTPRTTSSDTFDTATNQTPQTNFSPLGNSVREFYNDVLTGGQNYFKGILDVGGFVESPTRRGAWIGSTDTTGWTFGDIVQDGTHVNGAGVTYAVNKLDPSIAWRALA